MIALLVGCTGAPVPTPSDPQPDEVGWTRGLPPLPVGPRGHHQLRTIVHLHSPWSHDACDNDPQPDGVVNEPCLEDLRRGLCDAGIDAAFVTDHPAYAAEQPYDQLVHPRPGDVPVEHGSRLTCDDGRSVLWMPGIEDELMPLSLDRHVAGNDAVENDRLYNGYDAEAVEAERDAGAAVFVAHTEQRALDDLIRLQDAGMAGVEVFNLHAMFAPDIRQDALGLDPIGWVSDILPFTAADQTGEPDLLMLGVLQAQPPSLASWDALLARAPTTGVAGTDAHQNVLPVPLRDGERGDSYRRMLRWFSNVVLADGDAPDDLQAAIASGRTYVAFEILGTPAGFDAHLERPDGTIGEPGSTSPDGTVVVTCPTLDPRSPHGLDAPEITVHVLKDGAKWQEGCGSWPADGPGVYRVEVEIVPHHLRPFLGDDPEIWLHPYPWIYGNALRVGI
ncbi:MAG: hypothetical protein ABMB14_04330 [Myxococcota bacterium]